MITLTRAPELILGGDSKIDLLPPEFRYKRKSKVIRRRIGISLLFLTILIAGCAALLGAQAQQAQRDLAIAQANTIYLQSQQRIYSEVRRVQNELSTLQVAQRIGTATEIDWQEYLSSVQATLPRNVAIETIKIDAATPFAPYTQATVPLQGARIATLSFTAISPTLPQVPAWLISLTSLKGYADASPGSVVRNESGTYAVSITMHINQDAFSHRFSNVGNIS
ncbi:MAG: hypothetical protein H7227_02140 [Actinobacteria bacterium]|nr:hypothetical protein [Actinomycetota bacterium]